MKVLRFLNSIRADCGKTGTGLTTVKLKFDPMSGTGIDSHNESLLKLGKDSTATGVGIGIYGSDGKLLNLSANDSVIPALARVEKSKRLNVQEIPQKSASANTLQIALRQRIKVFYRPDNLSEYSLD